jgi:hypothetical protein
MRFPHRAQRTASFSVSKCILLHREHAYLPALSFAVVV